MYAARASQFAKTITMACSVQKQSAATTASSSSSSSTTIHAAHSTSATVPSTPKPRGSLPSEISPPPLEFHWPPTPVSTHTSNLRMNMMNHNPKDLHTARQLIEELRAKVRYQTEHILKWRKAYALQIQQHYRYQKEKTDQMNALTSQLLLLESRLKRKQKQIVSLLQHRELTIQRQQKIIDTLSTRLVDHGLETIEASYATELDSLNDSDSAVVLEDIDSDGAMTLGTRRKSSGSGGGGGGGGGGGSSGGDGITIVRSISDAIETNLNKYGGARRNNCFLRRPEILETVYSVEEDPEPSSSDVAEKRDKFKNRSEKALSSSSTEGQIDTASIAAATATTTTTITLTATATVEKTKEIGSGGGAPPPRIVLPKRQLSSPTPLQWTPSRDGCTAFSVRVPQLQTTPPAPLHDDVAMSSAALQPQSGPKSQVTNYNRVMSNHRSVTKPKDVKYKRINKAKSKSLEELRGRLKNLVERGVDGGGYTPSMMPQTAQSYA